jgi:hypothetical protein
MNTYQKIKRFRKHYKTGNAIQRKKLEFLLEKEIESRPDKTLLWASLIFDGDISYMTFQEKKAAKTASKHGVLCYQTTDKGIVSKDPLDMRQASANIEI